MRPAAHQVAPSQWASRPSAQVHSCATSQSRPGSRAGRPSSSGASGRSRSGGYPHRQNCISKQNNCWDNGNSREVVASSTGASTKNALRRPVSAGGRRSLRATRESQAVDHSGVRSGHKIASSSAMLSTEQRCCHAAEPLTNTIAIAVERTTKAAAETRNSHRFRPAGSRTKPTSGQRIVPVIWSGPERPSSASSTAARSAQVFCPSRASPCSGGLHWWNDALAELPLDLLPEGEHLGRTSREASSLCSDGLWFEWQRQEVSGGWKSVGVEANRALEEAYTLGEPLCRLWRDGFLREFDLRIGQEMGSSARIQRVRMPQRMSHTNSTCSTHMATHESLDSEEISVDLEGQLGICPAF